MKCGTRLCNLKCITICMVSRQQVSLMVGANLIVQPCLGKVGDGKCKPFISLGYINQNNFKLMVKQIFVLNNLTLKGGIALMELKQCKCHGLMVWYIELLNLLHVPMKDKFAKKTSFPLGLQHRGHNFIFQHKEVFNTCNEFIDFAKCMGKPYIWERFVGIGGDHKRKD